MKIQNDRTDGAHGAAHIASVHTPKGNKTLPDEAVRPAGEDSVETTALLRAVTGNPEKVERLRAAVRSGTYFVPAREIASTMIDEHLGGGDPEPER